MWRDQYVFVGDSGEILALGLQRSGSGSAEAKGWLSDRDQWRSAFYHRFSVSGRGGDEHAVLSSLSDSPGTPVRASLSRPGSGVTLRLRTPSAALTLQAAEMTPLGTARDPEGESEYHAGRALLESGAEPVEGWLISETTPHARPRREFVAFGDFVFLVAADAEVGPIVLKHSVALPAYDVALTLGAAGRPSADVDVAIETDRLRVTADALGLDLAFAVHDRDATHGVAPDGSAVRYDTLLLSGDGRAGVAFAIRPEADVESD